MATTENSPVIENLHHSSSSLWSNCRPDIQRRINALLNYQVEYFRLRVEFHRQLQDLQYAYNPEFERIIERQRSIIDGSCEPKELEKLINQSSIAQINNQQTANVQRKGLENFCFTLEFHFLPTNPFFIETILTKQYRIRFESNNINPYRSYDGPEVDCCYGSIITWKPDHNLTIRKRTKRIRNKITGQVRFECIEEPVKSFFEFFSSPTIPTNGIHEMTNEDQIRLEADIEFGLLLKQRVLPRAVLYYTGEALRVFNDEEEDDDDESTSSDSSR
ncbi:unnamed protein product [Rotaria socialis]|uniref:Uncharacterized protein n=1 Tax=Rotaria socialis TaxID=392032 RepID=A0A818CHE8_9BILA|nr:unnamed protein product [Rotaria socialis]CAF4133388.1 unnamed protein product [Rotaria socialis]